MIKGAIFDMDGTFLDSMGMWRNLPHEYLISKGKVPEEGLCDKFRAFTMEQAAKYYQDNYGITDDEHKIYEDIVSLIRNNYANNIPLKDGAIELFEALKAGGVQMCVATATDKPLALIGLQKLGVLHYFKEVFTCREVGIGKTDPKIFETALSCIGTKKEETVVFEDALHAIVTLKSANFRVCAIYDDSMKDDFEEIKSISDYHVLNLREIDLHKF